MLTSLAAHGGLAPAGACPPVVVHWQSSALQRMLCNRAAGGRTDGRADLADAICGLASLCVAVACTSP